MPPSSLHKHNSLSMKEAELCKLLFYLCFDKIERVLLLYDMSDVCLIPLPMLTLRGRERNNPDGISA